MTLPKSKYQEVLEQVPTADQAIVGLHANLIMNTSPGWRPSDAARRAVAEYERLGPHEFTKMHQRDHLSAAESCSCSACQQLAERLREKMNDD